MIIIIGLDGSFGNRVKARFNESFVKYSGLLLKYSSLVYCFVKPESFLNNFRYIVISRIYVSTSWPVVQLLYGAPST